MLRANARKAFHLTWRLIGYVQGWRGRVGGGGLYVNRQEHFHIYYYIPVAANLSVRRTEEEGIAGQLSLADRARKISQPAAKNRTATQHVLFFIPPKIYKCKFPSAVPRLPFATGLGRRLQRLSYGTCATDFRYPLLG